MVVSDGKDSLLVRVGEEPGEQALKEPHVSEFNITGRATKGCVLVAPDGIEDNDLFSPHGLLHEFGDLEPSFLHPLEPAVYPFLAVQVEGEEGNVTPCCSVEILNLRYQLPAA
jgi:hypothetical protein